MQNWKQDWEGLNCSAEGEENRCVWGGSGDQSFVERGHVGGECAWLERHLARRVDGSWEFL